MNVKSIVEERRTKIVSEYYDKILNMFDNEDRICISETESFPIFNSSYTIYIPQVHRQALLTLLFNKGFTIIENNNSGSYILYTISIED